MSIDVHFAKKTANRDLRVCAFLFIAFIAIFSLGLTGCAGVVSQAKNSDSTPIMPSITAEPTSQTVTLGQTATFAVAATGTAPMTYQWKKGARLSPARLPQLTRRPQRRARITARSSPLR